VTIKKLLAEGCFLQAIPLLTRQLARHRAIGADFSWRQGRCGSVVFDMKRTEILEQAIVSSVAQRKADCL
jgi:hypothetical protein